MCRSLLSSFETAPARYCYVCQRYIVRLTSLVHMHTSMAHSHSSSNNLSKPLKPKQAATNCNCQPTKVAKLGTVVRYSMLQHRSSLYYNTAMQLLNLHAWYIYDIDIDRQRRSLWWQVVWYADLKFAVAAIRVCVAAGAMHMRYF